MKILTLLLCAAVTVMAAADHSNMKKKRVRERRASCSSSTPSTPLESQGSQSHLDQLQASINQLTEERDCLKRRLCEFHGFTFGDGLCYYVSTEELNWEESRQWCKNRQSNLIVVNSREKQDLVERVNKQVWLGLTDRETEGEFLWVDGTPLTTPTFWYPREPNSYGGNEDCVGQYDGSVTSLPGRGWNDWPCSFSKHWICEGIMC